MTFDAEKLGLFSEKGYSIAVYVPAINESSGQLLHDVISISFSEKNSVVLSAAGPLSFFAALVLALF